MTQHPASSEASTIAHAEMAGSINAAMLDSRQRWRDFAMMTSDLCFETDALGQFVFLSPDPVLGWPTQSLLGQSSDVLITGSDFSQGMNPFRPDGPVRNRRVWLNRADGTQICFIFAAAPLVDDEGRTIGARGVGQDISQQEGYDAAVATALRRTEVLDHILCRMRQEVLAPRMMQAALTSLVTAMGLEGAAVLDLMGDGVLPTVLHQFGQGLSSVLFKALHLLEQQKSEQTDGPDGRCLMVLPCETRFGARAGLALWRTNASRKLDTDDATLAISATGLIRMILEHESIQREMARQARTDPLTGLLNRRAFLHEMGRRFERLDHEQLPGTLLYLDLDNFKALNDSQGHDLGDEALCLTAALLRGTVRPQDLVARLGGDEFAIWMDGTDSFSAAERAEILTTETPQTLAHLAGTGAAPLTLSIGMATRWPGRGEDVEIIMQRADQAMYDVKRAGRGHWRNSRTEDE